jgi:transcriptional regulator with XRE-family HTH domain
MFIMKNIGPRVVALRTEKGVSLSELARKSGISKSLLHRIENQADSNPELETLQKISRALGITVGELLGNEVVRSARSLPDERPEWLTSLTARLRNEGKEPDEDFLEALYVLQNRKGQAGANVEDWLYLYQTLERSFNRH